MGGLGNISLADVNLDGYIDIYINGSAKSKLLFNSSGAPLTSLPGLRTCP